jgi:hypothetical protein
MKYRLSTKKDAISIFLLFLLVSFFGWAYGTIYISLGVCIIISLLIPLFNGKINELNNKRGNYLLLLLSGGLGAVFYITVLSPKILNPSSINWLLSRGDSAQHFLGWHFFRNDPWTLPPGLITSLNTPIGTTITYTDSIPLLAFSFKIFNAILPETFQYFGIWILLCYILQGVFGFLLLRKITSNYTLQFLGLMFFIMSPIMLWRANAGHEALMGHWIILAALYLYKSQYKHIRWLLLLLISLLVHPYLFIMSFIIYVIKELELLFTRKNTLRTCLIHYFTAAVLILFTLWVVGFFYIGSSGEADGFGVYSMNINSIFNPQGWSQYLIKDQPSATPGQYEGFNYLGLGVIILLICSIYISLNINEKFDIKGNIGIVFMSIIFILIAISNVITFSDKILFEIPLPGIALKVGGIVRASGRFFWPVYYLIVLFSLSSIIKNTKTTVAALLLILTLSVQFTDLSGKFTEFRTMYSTDIVWESPLKSDVWNKIDNNEYKNIKFVPANVNGHYVAFSMLAAEKSMTINPVYTARDDYEKREAYNNKLLDDFEKGDWNSEDIYIVDDPLLEIATKMKKDSDLLAFVDGFNLLIPNGNIHPEFKNLDLDLNGFKYKYGEIIDFGINGNSHLVKNGGWSFSEDNATWTEGDEASLLFPIKGPERDLVLSLKMSPLLGGNIKGQHLIVSANNQKISEIICEASNTYQFIIPKDIINDQLLILISLPDAVSPKTLGINEDQRVLALSVESLSLDLVSP